MIKLQDVEPQKLALSLPHSVDLWVEYKIPNKHLPQHINFYSDEPYELYQKMNGSVIVENSTVFKDRYAEFYKLNK